MKFSTKLTVVFSIIILISGVAISYIVYTSNIRVLEDHIKDRLQNQAFHTMDKINRMIFERYATIRVIATDPVISSRKSTPGQITQRLLEYKNNYRAYASLSFFDLNRIRIADTEGRDIGKQHSLTEYWKALKEVEDIVSGIYVAESLKKQVFYFISPIRDRNGVTFGYISSRIIIESLQDIVKQAVGIYSVERDFNVELLDKDGFVIYSNQKADVMLKKVSSDWNVLKKSLEAGAKTGAIKFTNPAENKGEEILVFAQQQGYLDYKGNEWTLIIEAPTSIVFASAIELRNRILIISLAIALFNIPIIFLFSHRISKTVKNLSNASLEVSKGNLDVRVESRPKDEIGQLAVVFNRMIKDLRNHQAVLENKVAERTAELENELIERKKSDEVLEESETRYRTLVETSPYSIILADLNGNITFCNQQTLRSHGFDRFEDIIGTSCFDLFAPECRQRAIDSAQQTLANGGFRNVEYTLIKKDGSKFLAEASASLIVDSEGKPQGFVGVLRDITESKRTKGHLYIQYAVTRMLSESKDVGETIPEILKIICENIGWEIGEVWFPGKDDSVIRLSSAWYMPSFNKVEFERVSKEIIFTPGKGLPGRVWESGKPAWRVDIINDPDYPRSSYALKAGLHTAFAFPIKSLNRIIGVMLFFSTKTQPPDNELLAIFDSLGSQIGDFIERKKDEETIKLHRNELLSLAEASNVIAAAITSKENIYEALCNIVVKEFGLKMALIGLIEKGNCNVIPIAMAGFEDGYLARLRIRWNDSSISMGPVGMAIETQNSQVINDIAKYPRFTLWRDEAIKRGCYSSMVLPLVSSEGEERGVLDIYSSEPMFFTKERIQVFEVFANQAATAIENRSLVEGLEQRVRERTAELEVARLKAEAGNRTKSEFLANMSHELRTPLNTIIGFSEIMFDGMTGPLKDEQKEYLDNILQSGRHLLSMISDILELSRLDIGEIEIKPKEFELRVILEGILDMFKVKALKQDIKTSLDIEEGIETVTADERVIKQVATHLLSNAYKFTPDGGAVQVLARRVSSSKFQGSSKKQEKENLQLATSDLKPDGNFIEISVVDTGIGISEEDQKRLFTPFEQLEHVYTKRYGGTGLGLYFSKRLVELHGGRIFVESRVGDGSKFTFIIPLKE